MALQSDKSASGNAQPTIAQTSGDPAQHRDGTSISGDASVDHVTSQTANAQTPESSVSVPGGSNVLPEMKQMFAQLSHDMNSRFDAMSQDLHMMKAELTQTRRAIQDLETSVSFNADKIKMVEKEALPKIREEIECKTAELEEKLMLLELHHRKQNLLVYGVPEGKNENIYSTVYGVIAHFLQVSESVAIKTSLVNAHRLPAPKHTTAAPRPLIIRFANMEDRNRLLSAFEQPNRQRRNEVSGQQHAQQPSQQAAEPPPRQQATAEIFSYDRVTIRTDLPPLMKRERGRLATLAYKIRKEKHLATRIRINGTKLSLQTRQPARNGSPQSSWANWVDDNAL